LSACAVQSRNQAGKINGTDISYQDFVTAHRGHFDNFMVEKGRTPDSEEKQQMIKQTWRDITIHVILKSQFKKYNITVTNQELIDTLSNNVPNYLKNSPRFLANGKFDRSLYLQSLLYDTPVNLKPVKEHYYNYLIPIQKLKQKLIDSSMLSKKEYRLISDIVNSSADIDWIIFDPSEATVRISDLDIQSYYKENAKLFATTPKLEYEVALLPVKPTPQDSLQSQHIADSLYTELMNGASFAKLAELHSAAESAIRGGSLGYLLVMDLPKETKHAIADLDNGQVSNPVQINNSWMIFQVMSRTKSMIKINEIEIVPRPGIDTVNSSKQMIGNLSELARTIGMEKAAYEMDCDYFRTAVMQKDSLWINDLDVVNKVRSELPSVRPGAILTPIYSQRLGTWIVVRVLQNQTQSIKSIESVKASIITTLEQSRKVDVAKQMALNWLSRNAADPISAASAEQLRVERTLNMNIKSTLFTNPIKDVYFESVSLYHKHQRYTAYELDKMIVLPIVTNVRFNKKAADNPDLIRSCFAKNLPANWFDNWIEEQIRTANVKLWY